MNCSTLDAIKRAALERIRRYCCRRRRSMIRCPGYRLRSGTARARGSCAKSREGVTQLALSSNADGRGIWRTLARAKVRHRRGPGVRGGIACVQARRCRRDRLRFDRSMQRRRFAEVVRLQARARIAEAGEDWAAGGDVTTKRCARKLDPAVAHQRKTEPCARARHGSKLSRATLAGMIARADQLQ